MKTFMGKNFLLTTDTAKKLFFDHAQGMPMYDYHCHIDPGEILENRSYDNITQLWLYGDHYKWRLMRANGVEEKYITGDGGDYEKFLAFAGTLPLCPGNPVYHWSHLELRRYFGVDLLINEKNAPEIWELTRAQLGKQGLRCRDFIENSNVRLICTTDDPADSLEVHRALREEELGFRVLPAFRPDRAVELRKPDFPQYLERLEEADHQKIGGFEDLCGALHRRVNFFHANGCRLSDSGLTGLACAPATGEELDGILARARRGEPITEREYQQYQWALLTFLGREYAAHGWVMQLHLGAMRNNNTRMFELLGPDTGYDSLADGPVAQALGAFLDGLERENCLPKTILYCLNPKDSYVLASMAGNFQSGVPGKVQYGAAWWMLDHIDGMRDQLKTYSNLGVLGRFVGMLTDSRSFLSYCRHEYFRRILCDLLGQWVERGEYPDDMETLGRLVEDICYNNAVSYFGM